MIQSNPNWIFITKRYCEISQESDWPPWYSPWWECVVLDCERYNDIIPVSGGWTSWLMTDPARAVLVSKAFIQDIVSGQPSDIEREKHRQFMRCLATNALELCLDIAFENVPNEIFLLTHRGTDIGRCGVVVELGWKTFAQLPDFRAQLERISEEKLHYDPVYREVWEHVHTESRTDLWREAAATAPYPGCYFPMEIRSNSAVVPGVLALKELFGSCFKAEMFLCSSRINILPGTKMYRVAKWPSKGRMEQAEVLLATVKEVIA
jgi:hypothetical protein